MQRRRLLAALGAGLPFAGCVGTGSSDAPSSPTETTADAHDATTGTTTTGSKSLDLGESAETGDGRSVTVHDLRIRRTVFTRGVHIDPHSRPGEQFVVAEVSATDRELLRGTSVAADGDPLDAGPNDAVVRPFAEPTGELLGFAVPAPLDAERGAIVWTGPDDETARWSLGADHLDALAHPPEFEVRELAVPEEVDRGATFTASVTVANAGSGDGTFLAELGATTVSDTPEIRIEVPAGEAVTAERAVDPHYPRDADEMTVRLDWDSDALERVVGVV